MKRVMVLLSLTAMMWLLAACGGSDEAGGKKKYRIGMVSFANDPAFNTYELGAKQEAKKLGVDLEIQQMTNFEASTELAVLNALVAKKPDALLVTVQDAKALQVPLERIAKRGIKIVTYDSNAADPKFVATYVSSQYVKLGRDTAKALADLIGNRGKVLPFLIAPGNLGLEDHLKGFKQYMETKPEITVLPVQYNDGEPTKTAAIVKATLARHPDLAGTYLGTTVAGAQGGTAALRQLGKIGKVKAVTLDAAPAGVEDLKAGYTQAIVSSELSEIGRRAVKAAVDALDGKKLPPEILIDGCTLTKDNLDDPENQGCIYLPPEE